MSKLPKEIGLSISFGLFTRSLASTQKQKSQERKMKIQKKTFKKITRRCAALYRLYRKRIHMVEAELGGELHAC